MTTRYLDASIGGAKIRVKASDDELGARAVIHEFPGKRKAYAEPNGQWDPRFEFDAYVMQRVIDTPFDNFETRLDALEKVLLEDGPYKLVHPHRGTKMVALTGPVRVHRETGELGIVRFRLSLIEVEEDLFPEAPRDTRIDVKIYAADVRSRSLPRKFDVSGPDFLTEVAELILSGPRGLTSALSRVNNKIQSGFNAVDSLSRSITEFSNELTELLNTPSELGTTIQGLLNSLMSAIAALPFADRSRNAGDQTRPASRMALALSATTDLGLFGEGFEEVEGTGATRTTERDNQNDLMDVIEVAALSAGIEAMAELDFDSAEQGTEALEAVNAAIDHVLERDSLADEAAITLRALRAAFLAHVQATIPDRAGLGTYTPAVNQPAFLIAFELYGDREREQEIIDRNRIEHPGFVPGGVELVVSANAAR